MLIYPSIDPVAFSLGPLKVHWYGLMYLLSVFVAWGLATVRQRQPNSGWSPQEAYDIVFYAVFCGIIGGRVGYMLFYNFSTLMHKPWSLLFVWQGGMSIHGGLIAGIFGLWLFARHNRKPFLFCTDFASLLLPVGLFFGRIGNFINGELWGKPSQVPWAMVFPNADYWPRHPSQLYEAFFEGLLLFTLLWIYAAKKRPAGRVSGMFLLGYGSARIGVEFFREPDAHIGYLAFNWLTMGQLLSLPLIGFGLYLALRRQTCSNT